MNPTQQIALASVVTTGALGLAGMFATTLVARQGRKHAAELAANAQEHGLTLARIERAQQRRADTYVAILRWVHAVEDLLRARVLELDSPKDVLDREVAFAQEAIDRMEAGDSDEFSAKLWAYASDDVRNAYFKWHRAAQDLVMVNRDVAHAIESKPSEDQLAGRGAGEQLQERRDVAVADELTSRKRLRTLIRIELAG